MLNCKYLLDKRLAACFKFIRPHSPESLDCHVHNQTCMRVQIIAKEAAEGNFVIAEYGNTTLMIQGGRRKEIDEG